MEKSKKSKALENSIKTRQENKEKKKAEFIEEFSKKANNVSATCKAIGIERPTFYNWLKDDVDFRLKVENAEEGDIDMAESALKKQILGGNITAIIFYLKTKGKSRGYVERQEITGKDGVDIVIKEV
jgi:20S proteasome alpha/beta subunit